MVADTGGNYDVIIDDGSHVKEHQMIAARTLMPYLAVGGVYIVEDVQLSHAEELARAIGGYLVKGDRRSDDNLIIVRDRR